MRIRKTVSYLHHLKIIYFVYQKERNCIMPTVCLLSIFCESERGKLCHTSSMFMFYILWIRKGETVSYIQYVYVLYFVNQKGGNWVISIVCLCSRIRVSKRRKLHHTNSVFMNYFVCHIPKTNEKSNCYPTWVGLMEKRISSVILFTLLMFLTFPDRRKGYVSHD